MLRAAGVTVTEWARANYSTDGTWSGDACGCPDSRCKDGFHHSPQQRCGCLETLLQSYVSGEGQFAGESGYVIRDPLWAQVRRTRRRAGQHSGKPSKLCRFAAALDTVLERHSRQAKPSHFWEHVCDAHRDQRGLPVQPPPRDCPDCRFRDVYLCRHCACPNDEWPCPTYRDIATALLGEVPADGQ